MNPQRPEHEIDSLVRAYLRRQAESVDPNDMLRRVRSAQGKTPTQSVRRWRRVVLGLAAAAAALLIIFAGQFFGPGPARASVSAEAIVRKTREAHEAIVDRGYLVQLIPEPDSPLTRLPRLAQEREIRLWTRGDRFFFHPAEGNPPSWICGRDDTGHVWLVPGRRHGWRFAQKDLPSELAMMSDACSMDVSTILDEVLVRHELSHERVKGNPSFDRIRAELRRGESPRGFRSVVLEIDPETHTLRRLELKRTGRKGEPLVTLHATMIDTTTQPDARYTPEGHLPAGAPVFSTQKFLGKLKQRLSELRKFFHEK